MVCEPEEQKRLTVTAGTLSGRPARSDAMRATFVPDSPSGVAQPRITSSIGSGASCGVCASSARITSAAMSSGRVVRSDPARRLADRGAQGGDDDCFVHCRSPAL